MVVRSMAMRAEGPMLSLNINDIGGGKVVWPFRQGGKEVRRGTVLSAEQIMQIAPANRASLIGRFIRVWPKAPDATGLAPVANGERADGTERHVVSLGFRRYTVIEGVRLSEEPLTREQAYTLAGKSERKRRRQKAEASS